MCLFAGLRLEPNASQPREVSPHEPRGSGHLNPLRPIEDLRGRQREDLHDARELLHFVLAREQGIAGVELGQDAAEGPHVDGRVIPLFISEIYRKKSLKSFEMPFQAPTDCLRSPRESDRIYSGCTSRGSKREHTESARVNPFILKARGAKVDDLWIQTHFREHSRFDAALGGILQ